MKRPADQTAFHLVRWRPAPSTPGTSAAGTRTWGLHNNLWARVNLGLGDGTDGNLTVHARNNTFWHCSVSPNMASGGTWEWQDNVFDHGALWLYHVWPDNDYNAFVAINPMYGTGGHDVTLTSLDYLTDA